MKNVGVEDLNDVGGGVEEDAEGRPAVDAGYTGEEVEKEGEGEAVVEKEEGKEEGEYVERKSVVEGARAELSVEEGAKVELKNVVE